MIVRPKVTIPYPVFESYDGMRQFCRDKVKELIVSFPDFNSFIDSRGEGVLFWLVYNCISSKWARVELVDKFPQYCTYTDLVKYGKPDYPKAFAKPVPYENIKYSQIPVESEVVTVDGLKVLESSAYTRIMNMRLTEVLQLRTPQFEQFKDATRFAMYETEWAGWIVYLFMFTVPENIWNQVLYLITKSVDSTHARENIKYLTISMKRWPEYWGVVDDFRFYEMETIYGYILTKGQSQVVMNSIDAMMTPTPIHVIGDKDVFIDSYLNYAARNFSEDINEPITPEEYLNDWNQWTTGGAASEVRVLSAIPGKTKKSRCNKSALPLVVTKEQLREGYAQPNRAILKSEVGKVRLAFSAGTYCCIYEGYLFKKYRCLTNRHNYRQFVDQVPADKLKTYGSLMDHFQEGGVASTDIEKNDFIHSTCLDLLVLTTPMRAEQDPFFLKWCAWRALNCIEFKLENGNTIEVPHVTVEGKSYTWNYTAIASGLRDTTFSNDQANGAANDMASEILMSNFGIKTEPNIHGSDDSAEMTNNHYAMTCKMIIQTTTLMTINYTKSYVSDEYGEFFRVRFSRSKRGGYAPRLIHSIVSMNPVSAHEVDRVNVLHAFQDLMLSIQRRGANSTKTNHLFNIFAGIKKVPDAVMSIPVDLGGVGLFAVSALAAKPGIPRFVETRDIKDFKINMSWFNDLKMVDFDGVRLSYFETMALGIRDQDQRSEQAKRYRRNLDEWTFRLVKLPDYKRRVSPRMHVPDGYNYVQKITSMISYARKSKEKLPFRVLGDYQETMDLINRAEFSSMNSKLDYLENNGYVWFAQGTRNRIAGKFLLNLVCGQMAKNASYNLSLSADMTWIVKDTWLSGLALHYRLTTANKVVQYSTAYYQQLLVDALTHPRTLSLNGY